MGSRSREAQESLYYSKPFCFGYVSLGEIVREVGRESVYAATAAGMLECLSL